MQNNPLLFLSIFFFAIGVARLIYALILKSREERNNTND